MYNCSDRHVPIKTEGKPVILMINHYGWLNVEFSANSSQISSQIFCDQFITLALTPQAKPKGLAAY